MGLLVVIKAPARPAIWVVAGGAVAPQPAGMVDVLVAAAAGARGILVGLGPVAAFAGHGGVQSDQGEMGQVVVEGHCLAPTGLLVTGLAGRPKLALVRVVLAMAGDASGRQPVAPGIGGVAALAGELGVAAAQGEPRLVVVEADIGPLAGRMAGFAGTAVAPGVLVLERMAGNAGGGEPGIAFPGVALGAGHLLVGADQRKPRLGVVEGLHALPGLLAVTAFALVAQPTLVRIAGA